MDIIDIELKKKSVCFTGHRVLYGGITPAEMSERIKDEVLRLHGRGFTEFYAGGAIGFDMIAAITVLNLKLEHPDLHLHLALPCTNHSAKWTGGQRSQFDLVSRLADSITYVSECPYFNGCMQLRNRYMADRSSVCVAYLKNDASGTGYTVRYAQKTGAEIVYI